MNINCNIADDLLPLYVDDSCSADSREALEEHLRECPSCREKLDRMRRNDLITEGQERPGGPKLVNYSKKIRRRRIRIAILVVFLTVLAAAVLSLGYLTVQDMRRQSNPAVFDVEAGTCNLTAGILETTAEEVNRYTFCTNYTQIAVTVQPEGMLQGTVILCNAANVELLYGTIDADTSTCTFTGLTAAQRYKVKCEGLDGATIRVSEGRTVSFWSSLESVLYEIMGSILLN